MTTDKGFSIVDRRHFMQSLASAGVAPSMHRALASDTKDRDTVTVGSRKPILALVGDEWGDWELGFLLGVAGFFLKTPGKLATASGKLVMSAGGLVSRPDESFETIDVSAFAGFALIGGPNWLSPVGRSDDILAATLRKAVARGIPVGAIGSGTLGLARAGLLDTVAHTSDAPGFIAANAPTYRGGAFYQSVAHAVTSGALVTAPGTAPVTFAIEMLKLAYPGNGDTLASLAKLSALEHQA